MATSASIKNIESDQISATSTLVAKSCTEEQQLKTPIADLLMSNLNDDSVTAISVSSDYSNSSLVDHCIEPADNDVRIDENEDAAHRTAQDNSSPHKEECYAMVSGGSDGALRSRAEASMIIHDSPENGTSSSRIENSVVHLANIQPDEDTPYEKSCLQDPDGNKSTNSAEKTLNQAYSTASNEISPQPEIHQNTSNSTEDEKAQSNNLHNSIADDSIADDSNACRVEEETHQSLEHAEKSEGRKSVSRDGDDERLHSDREKQLMEFSLTLQPTESCATGDIENKLKPKTSEPAPTRRNSPTPQNVKKTSTSTRRKTVAASDGKERSKSRSRSRVGRKSTTSISNNKNILAEEKRKDEVSSGVRRSGSVSRHRNLRGEGTLRKSESFRLPSQRSNRNLRMCNSASSLNYEGHVATKRKKEESTTLENRLPSTTVSKSGLGSRDGNSRVGVRERRVRKSNSFNKLTSQRSSRNLQRARSARSLHSEEDFEQKKKETTTIEKKSVLTAVSRSRSRDGHQRASRSRSRNEHRRVSRSRSRDGHPSRSRSRDGQERTSRSRSRDGHQRKDKGGRTLRKSRSFNRLTSERNNSSGSVHSEEDVAAKQEKKKETATLEITSPSKTALSSGCVNRDGNPRGGRGERRLRRSMSSNRLTAERPNRHLQRSHSSKSLQPQGEGVNKKESHMKMLLNTLDATCKEQQEVNELQGLSCADGDDSNNEKDTSLLANIECEDKEIASSSRLNVQREEQANDSSKQQQKDVQGNRRDRAPRPINRRSQMSRRSTSSRGLYRADMRKQFLKTSSLSNLLKELDTSENETSNNGKSCSNGNEVEKKNQSKDSLQGLLIEVPEELNRLSDAGQLDRFNKLFSNHDEQDKNNMSSNLFLKDDGGTNCGKPEQEQKENDGNEDDDVKRKSATLPFMVLKTMAALKSKQLERKSKKEKLLGRINRASLEGY